MRIRHIIATIFTFTNDKVKLNFFQLTIFGSKPINSVIIITIVDNNESYLLHKTIFKGFWSDTERLETPASIDGEVPFDEVSVS